ncbi:MAG: hypothetical protein HUU21_01570 [Polyangiaceae bacterium]|nr:hypothetical protein [Polyangiaceae bacterium]
MSLPASHHAFLQRATFEGCEERGFVDGRAGDIRTRHIDAPHVTRPRGILEAARDGAGGLLRSAGRLIFVSPALLVVKLILYLMGEHELSDYVILVFVGFVIAFFAALNLYVFTSILWWAFGRSPRAFLLKRPFDDDGRPALPSIGEVPSVGPEPAPIGRLVRARGSVVRLGPVREGDGTVLRDLWLSSDMDIRLTEAVDFAVVARGQIPVVVRLDRAPLVITKPSVARLEVFASDAAEGTMSLLADSPTAAVEGSLVVLREGDEVEVTGVVAAHIDNVDGFDLAGTFASVPLPSSFGEGAASPFRDRPGGAGLVLGEGPGAPISIRRLDAA